MAGRSKLSRPSSIFAVSQRHGLASCRKSVLDTSQFIGDPARPAQGELFARATPLT